MVEYEVSVDIDPAIADDYLLWLWEHIDHMLALPGFIDATMLKVDDPTAAAGSVRLCVRYRLHDREALAHYLGEYAAGMRAEGQARFGDRFRASRRVLEPLSRWS